LLNKLRCVTVSKSNQLIFPVLISLTVGNDVHFQIQLKLNIWTLSVAIDRSDSQQYYHSFGASLN